MKELLHEVWGKLKTISTSFEEMAILEAHHQLTVELEALVE